MLEINKTDKRYVKIETRLRDALIELIDQRDFQSLTITDITDTAEVGRATFYKHYNDKYELLDAIEKQMLREIRVVVSCENNKMDDPYHKVLALFTYLDEHAKTAKVLFGLRGSEKFQHDVYEILWDGFQNMNKRLYLLIRGSGVPVEYLRSLVHMHFMIICTWLRKEERETPEEMTKIFSKISALSGEWISAASQSVEFRHIYPV